MNIKNDSKVTIIVYLLKVMRVSQVHKEKALHCKEDAVLDHNSYPERFPTKSNKHPREV